jgi:hypothetical protein
VLPFGLYLLFFGSPGRTYYFLPVILPLASCVANPALWDLKNYGTVGRNIGLILAMVTLVLCGWQWWHYTGTDQEHYTWSARIEEENPSLAFYRKLDEDYLSRIPSRKGPLRVLMDLPSAPWGVWFYLPDVDHLHVQVFPNYSGMGEYKDIEHLKPDLILLSRWNVQRYSTLAAIAVLGDPSVTMLEEPQLASRIVEFYRDAGNGSLKGYRQVLQTEFAIAFEKDKSASARTWPAQFATRRRSVYQVPEIPEVGAAGGTRPSCSLPAS